MVGGKRINGPDLDHVQSMSQVLQLLKLTRLPDIKQFLLRSRDGSTSQLH